jgi:hypothetical protein
MKLKKLDCITLEKLEPSMVLLDDTNMISHEVTEMDFSSNKRYLIAINIGNLSPKESVEYVNTIKDTLGDVFPTGTVLFTPYRDPDIKINIHEMITCTCGRNKEVS